MSYDDYYTAIQIEVEPEMVAPVHTNEQAKPNRRNKKYLTPASNRFNSRNKKGLEVTPVMMYFPSNIRGRNIVSGSTGIPTDHIVGTLDEDLYFKVVFPANTLAQERVTLFYANPREYCQHFVSVLDKSRKMRIMGLDASSIADERLLIQYKTDKIMHEIQPAVDVWNSRSRPE